MVLIQSCRETIALLNYPPPFTKRALIDLQKPRRNRLAQNLLPRLRFERNKLGRRAQHHQTRHALIAQLVRGFRCIQHEHAIRFRFQKTNRGVRVFQIRVDLVYTVSVGIDHELKQSLEELLQLCREYGVRPRLIGGLAVRGFARRKRFTHDIDLAINRHDQPNLIAILKQMGFDYQALTQFEGVKAAKRVGNTTVEIHISVERLWDMTSNQTYTLSSESAQVAVDDSASLLAPTVSAEDLLILKLIPLRDRDLCDIIALLLDAPAIDARKFWSDCERTANTHHIVAQLAKLENALKSGAFREAWTEFYGEQLSAHDVVVVLDKVRSIQKAKP